MNSLTEYDIRRHGLGNPWHRAPFQPANRAALIQRGKPAEYRAMFAESAMDLGRKMLPAKSQWTKAAKSDFVWPNHWSDGRLDSRNTERIITDDEEEEPDEFWSFMIEPSFSAQKRKHPEIKSGLTDTYQGLVRSNEHRRHLMEMGIWWSLFTGQDAEQLMYWFSQGMSLQALTFLAKSRLHSSRKLIPGREAKMVNNFIWARQKNPQDSFRENGKKRLKTQSEEDGTMIWTQMDEGRRCDKPDGRKRYERRCKMPSGALARLKFPQFKLCKDRKPFGRPKVRLVATGLEASDEIMLPCIFGAMNIGSLFPEAGEQPPSLLPGFALARFGHANDAGTPHHQPPFWRAYPDNQRGANPRNSDLPQADWLVHNTGVSHRTWPDEEASDQAGPEPPQSRGVVSKHSDQPEPRVPISIQEVKGGQAHCKPPQYSIILGNNYQKASVEEEQPTLSNQENAIPEPTEPHHSKGIVSEHSDWPEPDVATSTQEDEGEEASSKPSRPSKAPVDHVQKASGEVRYPKLPNQKDPNLAPAQPQQSRGFANEQNKQPKPNVRTSTWEVKGKHVVSKLPQLSLIPASNFPKASFADATEDDEEHPGIVREPPKYSVVPKTNYWEPEFEDEDEEDAYYGNVD